MQQRAGLGLGAVRPLRTAVQGPTSACHIPSGLRGMKLTLERNSATNLVKGGLCEPWGAIQQVKRCRSVCPLGPGTASSDVEVERGFRVTSFLPPHSPIPKQCSVFSTGACMRAFT